MTKILTTVFLILVTMRLFGSDTKCCQTGIGRLETKQNFREVGRFLAAPALTRLTDVLLVAIEENELSESTRSEILDIIGRTYLFDAEPIEHHIDVMEVAPICLMAGIYQHDKKDVIPTIRRFEQSVELGLKDRSQSGRIDPELERPLHNKIWMFISIVRESLNLSLMEKDTDLCWEIIRMSADSPIVWVRKNALFTLREWIDDQGIPISRKDDMRNMLDLMEKREKLLLSSTYGDCTISRHASRVSLKHIEWIRNALNGIPNVENRKVYTR